MSADRECRVCGDAPAPDAPVAGWRPANCADCGRLHHVECFEYLGRCSRTECAGLRYAPSAAPVCAPEESDHPARSGPHEPAPLRPTTRLILDLMTPAEELVRIPTLLGVVVLVIALPLAWYDVIGPLTALASLCAGGLSVKAGRAMTRSTDCYFVVDAEMKQVLYHQKILGHTRLLTVASFEDVARFELVSRVAWRPATEDRPRGYSYRAYELYLVDRHGERVLVSDRADSDAAVTGLSVPTLESRGWGAVSLIGCPFIWREPRRWGLFLVQLALAAIAAAALAGIAVISHGAFVATVWVAGGTVLCGLLMRRLFDWITPVEPLPEQCVPSERLRQAGGAEAAKRLPART